MRRSHTGRRASADRTRSWRRRAGSRRNKRLRNVGTHKGEVTLEIPSPHGTNTDTVNPAGDPKVWPQPPYSPRTEAPDA